MQPTVSRSRQTLGQRLKSRIRRWLPLAIASSFTLVLITPWLYGEWVAVAQSGNVQKQEDQLIRDFTLPKPPPQAPVFQPAPPAPVAEPAPAPEPAPDGSAPAPTPKPVTKPATATGTSDYVLEFNRSPVVGNRLRMQGIYASSRLGFTRPRSWQIQSAKAVVRFQHSPALLASRSNLTVQVNGANVGIHRPEPDPGLPGTGARRCRKTCCGQTRRTSPGRTLPLYLRSGRSPSSSLREPLGYRCGRRAGFKLGSNPGPMGDRGTSL